MIFLLPSLALTDERRCRWYMRAAIRGMRAFLYLSLPCIRFRVPCSAVAFAFALAVTPGAPFFVALLPAYGELLLRGELRQSIKMRRTA